MVDAQRWIDALDLRPHPEGGWFREVYRATEGIGREALLERFGGERAFSTAIYFLLEGGQFSALHRIKQDELWHFYDGAPVAVHRIDPSGGYSAVRLGRNVEAGEWPMAVVPAGWLFGATVDDAGAFALVGCTVAPGFDFEDFEMPGREELVARFPEHREVIERLTRG